VVNLYIRAKIGFCNCTTGVSVDEELDRLADFRLMGEKTFGLKGRQPDQRRLDEGAQSGISISNYILQHLPLRLNDRCDAVVATALVAHPLPAPIEPSVIAFLNSQTYSLGRNNAGSLGSLS
jgi:hypothetical protein